MSSPETIEEIVVLTALKLTAPISLSWITVHMNVDNLQLAVNSVRWNIFSRIVPDMKTKTKFSVLYRVKENKTK